jgi:hypothetical protein
MEDGSSRDRREGSHASGSRRNSIMRGRWPDGLEYIDNLDAAMETKKRLQWIIQVLAGDARVVEACTALDVSETRYYQLRATALQAALTAIEPRPAGRPSRVSLARAEQIRVLQQRVRELEQGLHEAEVREEITLVLQPAQRHEEGDGITATCVEKKMRRRRVKIRKSR